MNPLAAAVKDLIDGARLAPLWMRVGWEQVVARFRRTILGPFWLSANLLAISFALAFVFGAMQGADYRSNFGMIISGILAWSILGGLLGEASTVFISSAGLMHTQKLPLSFHIYLMMHRAFINFLAQLIAFWAVMALLRLGALPTWHILLGLPIVLIDSFLMSVVVAVPSTRFRDVAQLVQFSVQILFFLTPIFYGTANMSPNRRAVFELNPFAHLVEIVRQPLLGHAPAMNDWIWSLGTMGVLAVLAVAVLALYRRRVVFWL